MGELWDCAFLTSNHTVQLLLVSGLHLKQQILEDHFVCFLLTADPQLTVTLFSISLGEEKQLEGIFLTLLPLHLLLTHTAPIDPPCLSVCGGWNHIRPSLDRWKSMEKGLPCEECGAFFWYYKKFLSDQRASKAWNLSVLKMGGLGTLGQSGLSRLSLWPFAVWWCSHNPGTTELDKQLLGGHNPWDFSIPVR